MLVMLIHGFPSIAGFHCIRYSQKYELPMTCLEVVDAVDSEAFNVASRRGHKPSSSHEAQSQAYCIHDLPAVTNAGSTTHLRVNSRVLCCSSLPIKVEG